MSAQSADNNSNAGTANRSQTARNAHYTMPTTAYVLPQYSNTEQEIIRGAFSTGSFRTIAQLPTEIRPNYVAEALATHVDANLTSQIERAPWNSYKKVGKDVPFESFEYMPSPFGLADELKAKEREQHHAKVQEIAQGKHFLFSSSTPDPKPLTDRSPPASRASSQQQQLALSEPQIIAEPYDALNDAKSREKWLQASKILHGPFMPATRTKSLEMTVSRVNLPQIMQRIAKEMDADWTDATFQIYSDPEDLIIIKFELATVDSATALLAYMNMLSNNNPIITEPGLSRVVELWNHTPGDGCVYFCYKPPFVRRSVTDVYFTLYPERKDPRWREKMTALQMAQWKARQEKEQGLAPGTLSPRKRVENNGASESSASSAEETAAAVQQSLTFTSELAANAGSGRHQPPIVTADPELAEYEQYKIQRLQANEMKLSSSAGAGAGAGDGNRAGSSTAAPAAAVTVIDPRRTAAGMLAAPGSAGTRRATARVDDDDPNSAGYI